MRISDWTSDVCSSDLFVGRDRAAPLRDVPQAVGVGAAAHRAAGAGGWQAARHRQILAEPDILGARIRRRRLPRLATDRRLNRGIRPARAAEQCAMETIVRVLVGVASGPLII